MYTITVSRKFRRRKIAIAAIVVSIVLILIKTKNLLTSTRTEPYENVSCHYATTGNILPVIEEDFFTHPNTIFFHQTSCQVRISSRQACAIESAARAHPNWPIHVLVSAPLTKSDLVSLSLKLLDRLWNVYFYRIHIDEYSKGSPLEKLVNSGALNRTIWPVSHTTDVLRYLTLYKFGGVVLDFNTIVAKSFEGLGKNWAIRDKSLAYIRSDALAFDRDGNVGQTAMEIAVRILSENFKVDWGENGPRVITDTLREICSTYYVRYMTSNKCSGFQILPSTVMYSLDVNSNDEIDIENNVTYIYHVENWPVHLHQINEDAPYAKLAQKYCPLIYDNYGKFFGI